jgi:hypothetical protein
MINHGLYVGQMPSTVKLTGPLEGCAIAEAVNRWQPGFGKWDLWWTKWRQGKFSPSTSVSPAKNRSFQQLHHHHNHPGQLAEALP